jgi:hypothetical protein
MTIRPVRQIAIAALAAAAASAALAASAAAVTPGPNGPIAFSPLPQGEVPQVFLVNPDGSFLSQGTAAPRGASMPVWFPDGRRVAYRQGNGSSSGTATVLDVATGRTRRARAADVVTSRMFGRVTFSPDGSRVAYETAFERIRIATRGAGTRDLTAGNQPDWSPTGTQLVFARDGGIFTINADGTGATQLIAGSAARGAGSPSWSPDGTRIAFFSIAAGLAAGDRLEVMNADGTGRTVIATGEIGRLAWSPDGSRIAFVRGVPKGSLWTINPDGSAPTLIASNALYFSWGTGPLLTRRLLPPPDRRAVNATVVSGKVLVRRRGARRFRRLRDSARIPYGSELDTRRGKVRIVAAARAGKTATAVFNAGRFVLARRAGAVTELRLSGPLAGCGRATAGTDAVSARRRGRRLWGNGKGRFRSRGRRSATTVTGTKWLVEDRCDGTTLTRVARGVVRVRDFKRHRTVTVRARHSYVARP